MVLVPLPAHGFDPTEASVAWSCLREAGHEVVFATPDGKPSAADPRLLTGEGFGLLAPLLMAGAEAVAKYRTMSADRAFLHPIAYDDIRPEQVTAVVIPGGHAKGVKTLLESARMQQVMAELFPRVPVAAVCHGVVLLARSRSPETGRSVLYGRKTTALTAVLELGAWWLTRWWLGDYYRTYPVTVQAEVSASLAGEGDFRSGPLLPRRDSPAAPERGFVVRDGDYLSARWPGDCHHLGVAFVQLLAERRNRSPS
jgi:putative intracellular protease/amidase